MFKTVLKLGNSLKPYPHHEIVNSDFEVKVFQSNWWWYRNVPAGSQSWMLIWIEDIDGQYIVKSEFLMDDNKGEMKVVQVQNDKEDNSDNDKDDQDDKDENPSELVKHELMLDVSAERPNVLH